MFATPLLQEPLGLETGSDSCAKDEYEHQAKHGIF
ncbi:MAG: hypothetical protein ACJA06_001196 [Halocynthiibacter sp.]|jgi:hypothetical protein